MSLSKQQVLEMRNALDEQYKKDRNILDGMLDLLSRSSSNSNTFETQTQTEDLSINDKIYSYILSIQGNFTKQQLSKFIAESNPNFHRSLNDQAISTALWKLKKDQKIKIVIPKKGISGAIYSRVKDDLL